MAKATEVLNTKSELIVGVKLGVTEDSGLDRDGNLVRTPCDVGEILSADGTRVRVYLRTPDLVSAFNEIELGGDARVIRTTRTVKDGKGTKEQMFHDFLKAEASAPRAAPAADALER